MARAVKLIQTMTRMFKCGNIRYSMILKKIPRFLLPIQDIARNFLPNKLFANL